MSRRQLPVGNLLGAGVRGGVMSMVDVAQWFDSRISNPKTLGSIPPLAEQGKGTVFLPLRVDSRTDLFVLAPPSCVRHAAKFVRTLKIPCPSVVKQFCLFHCLTSS